jgi:D-beta-D-heptose 7-phosphate kinase / D-beta-D-heptose 1-phosphate adenosyltransferase
MTSESRRLLDKLRQVKALVVGDVMLDRYWWGTASRISPEAPVPVVRLEKEELIAGGAANVAANVVGLGAEVFLVGITGDDREAELLAETLEKGGISAAYLVKCQNRPTTLKTRVVVNHQQVARIDQETTENLSQLEEDQVWEQISACLQEVDVVLVSDYGKGFLSETLLTRLIMSEPRRDLPILIDPKGKDYRKYRGAAVLTPNRKEALEAVGFEGNEDQVVIEAGCKLLSELNLRAVLVTRGEEGMTLFEKGKEPLHLEALARHVFDVTGAGDTVIATLGVVVGAGLELTEAAEIANVAAGFVVEEIGTTAIKKSKLESLSEIRKP